MILEGDCLDILQDLPPDSYDSLVTDPPAGINFMSKNWDHNKGGRDHWIKWLEVIMLECYRVLKPGAHGFVWALPRTSHWTATALENAGLEVRDVVTHLFSSGFPKSHNLSKAIDKMHGAEREVVGQRDDILKKQKHGWQESGFKERKLSNSNADITAPATDGAKQWDGWGTALKPANEHWILVRKPLAHKTVAKNVMAYGTGAINIDACRVEYKNLTDKKTSARPGHAGKKTTQRINIKANQMHGEQNTQGRFPANVVLSGDAPEMLDAQSGVRSPTGKPKYTGTNKDSNAMIASSTLDTTMRGHSDAGGASRFFYCAKASVSERGKENNHPTVKPIKLMRYLIKMITPPGGTVLDPFTGSGSTAVASMREGFNFLGIEKEKDYVEIARKRLEAEKDLFSYG